MSDKTIKEQLAEKWPDSCPECGLPAWIGPVNITCVGKSCRHGSAEEQAEYMELFHREMNKALSELNELIETAPKPSLIFEDDEDTQPQAVGFSFLEKLVEDMK